MTVEAPPSTPQSCQVFPAEALYVVQGVAQGDSLAGPDEVCPGDIYTLEAAVKPLRLRLVANRVAPGSEFGSPGAAATMLARYTLMDDEGGRLELMVIGVEGAGLCVLPLSPVSRAMEYTLVKVEPAPEAAAVTDLLCISFARGTMITMADGSQRAIETLTPGLRVLTRDHGPQPVQFMGQATLRAVGAFAPVVITSGTMGNAGDLIVSQHHRMFLYLRNRAPGVPTAELLVQARHLVDGEQVFIREGGFVDYFSIVFPRHEIIYAEGIPAESLMVTEAVLNRLPAELAHEVKTRFPGLSQNQHFGTEAQGAMLDSIKPFGGGTNR